MNFTFSISQLNTSHLENMVAIGNRALPDWLTASLRPGLEEGFRRGNLVLGAFVDGELVGWLDAKKRIYNDLGDEPVTVYMIILLAVEKEYHGGRAGIKLVRELIRISDGAPVSVYIPADNMILCRFFAKLGFFQVSYEKKWFKNGEDVRLYMLSS